ncbi:hypothetical protein [Nocardiopsis algeriensis]|uniref:Uncharacterized protein n=1 Tax=Nocardiopsis algeriensis TaxID=1478215 RepID=A0A841IJD1_9ACTN|nr:hypothetical protein [Nocardiopsis algeriensis]MBB6118837.1 hypothetical protein [Nocardiopsis algeriensis]
MEIVLSGGRRVVLGPAAVEALASAEPFPGNPDVWCPQGDNAALNASLISQGLAERTSEGLLVLTPRGVEARGRARRLASALGPGTSSGRVVIDPHLGEKEAKALRRSLERPVSAGADEGALVPAARVLYGMMFAVFAGIVILDLPVLANLLLAAAAALALVLPQGLAARRGRRERAEALLAESLTGHHVSPEMLDEDCRGLLRRAQGAVDAVLSSSLHEEGLLLDSVRNRVVLADAEWSVAEGLLRQTRERERMAGLPTPGELSRRASDRALAALDRDLGRIAERVRLLEEYADRVRAAEDERQDRASAREFDAIAERAAVEGAAHRQQEEALASLVRAQETALRVAEFDVSGDPGPQPSP